MAVKMSRLRMATEVLVPLAASVGLLTLGVLPGRAAENYVIPQSDGYGIGECMRAGSACGRVMADSWCEAHGHAHVLAFGTVEDVTGTVQASAKPDVAKSDAAKSDVAKAAAGDVLIRCDD